MFYSFWHQPHTRTLSQLQCVRACERGREKESGYLPYSLTPTYSMTGSAAHAHPHPNNGSPAHLSVRERLCYIIAAHTHLCKTLPWLTILSFLSLFCLSHRRFKQSYMQGKAWLKHTHLYIHTHSLWVGASCHERGWVEGYKAGRAGNFSRLVLYKQV